MEEGKMPVGEQTWSNGNPLEMKLKYSLEIQFGKGQDRLWTKEDHTTNFEGFEEIEINQRENGRKMGEIELNSNKERWREWGGYFTGTHIAQEHNTN